MCHVVVVVIYKRFVYTTLGERTPGGLFDIIATCEALGVPMNTNSIAVDFGSGRGIPNFIFGLFAGMSLGIEHDHLRHQVCCYERLAYPQSPLTYSYYSYYSAILKWIDVGDQALP